MPWAYDRRLGRFRLVTLSEYTQSLYERDRKFREMQGWAREQWVAEERARQDRLREAELQRLRDLEEWEQARPERERLAKEKAEREKAEKEKIAAHWREVHRAAKERKEQQAKQDAIQREMDAKDPFSCLRRGFKRRERPHRDESRLSDYHDGEYFHLLQPEPELGLWEETH